MLTIEQEQTKMEDFQPDLIEKLNRERIEMTLLTPEKGIDKLLKKKASEFGMSEGLLMIELVDMTFLILNRLDIPKEYEKYHYTQKWFEFYISKHTTLNPFTDFFNEYITTKSSLSIKGLGQCMTPNKISNLVAKCLEPFNKEEPNSVVNISDISCGTGSMILKQLEEVSKNKEINIYVNDIDKNVAQICFIQLFFNIKQHLKNSVVNLYVYRSCALLEYQSGGNKCISALSFKYQE